MKCHLFDKVFAEKRLVPYEDWISSDISAWPDDMLGPCSGVQCDVNSRCDVNTTSHAVCTRTLCGKPPAVPNALPTWAPRKLGTKLLYRCAVPHFIMMNEPAQIVCTAQGTWTTPTFSCHVVCPSPFPIPPGTTLSSGNSSQMGSVLTYTCHPDLTLVDGPAQITCLDTGLWSAPSFKCIRPVFVTDYQGDEGIIYSPDYPNVYPLNLNPATITVTLSQSRTQMVEVTGAYDLESGPPCATDYVIINKDEVRYCGNDSALNKTFQLTGQLWYIDLFTDGLYEYHFGFKFNYRVFPLAA
ncbi:complement receptor type 1-like [Babylonia areolata]|uniref:complement receptor type 1-like n=1 Tax=Babylonia areolata TaxID=304850 RepID=UPI003FD23B19